MSLHGWRDAVAVSALLFAVSGLAAAAESETLRVAVGEFPPGFVSQPDDKVGGTAVPIVEALLREAGYKTDLHIYPIGRVRAMLDEGSADLSIATHYFDPDSTSAIFTQTPFGTIRVSLFSREDTPTAVSLAELNGKTVIVPYGQTTPLAMLRLAAPTARIEQPRTHENALHMLRSGRADYLLDWQEPIVMLLSQRKEHLRQVDLPPEYSYFIVSRRRKDAATVAQRLDAASKTLVGEDTPPAR